MANDPLREFPAFFQTLTLPSEAATQQLADDVALMLKPGDLLCLSGDLGAGKSTFSRALIRNVAADPDLEVPSPTFTLVQPYDLPRLNLAHFDLYRLEEPEELDELGLEEFMEDGAALIEWPEKADGLLPDTALWIQFQHGEDETRRKAVFFSEDPIWQERLATTLQIRRFLDGALGAGAERHHLAGDASLRTFEKIGKDGQISVLMRWPFSDATLSAPVRDYMDKVHLAKDCRSVVAIGTELRKAGIQAPTVLKADFEAGLVLSEYLGGETIVVDGQPVPERYFAAVDVLAKMHAHQLPAEIRLEAGGIYRIPVFSTGAMIAEASLILEWYFPEKVGVPVSGQSKAEFEAIWGSLFEVASKAQQGWILRDYHSPNLLWQEEASGTDRIGVIDFQDTVMGPVAYDVASLLLDARTDVDATLENALYDAYVKARSQQTAGFDAQAFSSAYSIMAAQRISKILGIFVRLARRDGKPAYLGHLPRMEGYLDRVLAAPVLSDLKDWYQQYRA